MEDKLFKYISERHTNRKPYRIERLTGTEKTNITQAAKQIENTILHIIENPSEKKELMSALSLNDELIFSNQKIHDMLFGIINWTEKEDRDRVRGLYVKTMELNNEQVLAFRQLENWSIMKQLKKIGIPKLIANTNKKLYEASSALGLISVLKADPQSFLLGGRAVERVWLTAVANGLCFHPVSGIPYLALRIKNGDVSNFDKREAIRIINADRQIRKDFRVGNRYVALVFRIGKGNDATARSKKLAPQITEEKNNV